MSRFLVFPKNKEMYLIQPHGKITCAYKKIGQHMRTASKCIPAIKINMFIGTFDAASTCIPINSLSKVMPPRKLFL